MSQMVTDLLKRQSLGDQMHGAGVPKDMGSVVLRFNFRACDAPVDYIVETANRKRPKRSFER